MIELVGIDADDTLWDEAAAFDRAEARFVNAVAEWTATSGSAKPCRRPMSR